MWKAKKRKWFCLSWLILSINVTNSIIIAVIGILSALKAVEAVAPSLKRWLSLNIVRVTVDWKIIAKSIGSAIWYLNQSQSSSLETFRPIPTCIDLESRPETTMRLYLSSRWLDWSCASTFKHLRTEVQVISNFDRYPSRKNGMMYFKRLVNFFANVFLDISVILNNLIFSLSSEASG